MRLIEIFRTNVQSKDDAKKVVAFFLNEFPCYRTNFDLEDEDNVFRVEANQNEMGIDGIINSMINLGYSCERIE